MSNVTVFMLILADVLICGLLLLSNHRSNQKNKNLITVNLKLTKFIASISKRMEKIETGAFENIGTNESLYNQIVEIKSRLDDCEQTIAQNAHDVSPLTKSHQDVEEVVENPITEDTIINSLSSTSTYR
ncbi:MAG: hypothetical protein ACXVCY_04490 [Pseudobdellovibrionaceae bacterium]